MRLLRSDMIATLKESYMKTARSKGLSTRRILWQHAFWPSSLTLLTFFALNMGTLVGGAVVVETVFSLPGLGTEIYNAIIGSAVRGAPELRRAHRRWLRAHQLRCRLPLHRPRPTDPAWMKHHVAESCSRTEVAVAAEEAPFRVRRRRFGVGGWIAAGWMVLLVAASLLAPVLPLADPDASDASIARQAPSAAALLGGDANGRDVLARVVYGARASLLIGFGAIVIGLVVGGAVGLIGGYYRRRIDTLVAGTFDVMLSVPARSWPWRSPCSSDPTSTT